MAVAETDSTRKEIEALQDQVRELEGKITELRRQRPPEPVRDYELKRSDGTPVRLSELFGNKKDLWVVHNMGKSCPMCTTWADGFNGLARHLADRAAFVVSSPDAPEDQRAFAASRGWTFPMVSIQGTSFALDLGMKDEAKDFHFPGVSAFRKADDGGITRVAYEFFGPGDPYCAMWPLMDLLAEGQDDWWPKIEYAAE